jgi:hypothetical protein
MDSEKRVKGSTDELAKRTSKESSNQQARVEKNMNVEKAVKHSTVQPAKKSTKESGVKAIRPNFKDLPYDVQVKLLNKAESEWIKIIR